MKGRKFLGIGFAAMALCGVAGLFQRFLITAALRLMGSSVSPRQGASIGIIGGADGPTAIFVTGPHWTAYILPAVLTVAGVCGILWLRKAKQNH